MKIHLCSYANKHNILILCKNEWTTPAPPSVLLADNKDTYTFCKSLVTCSACLARINKKYIYEVGG